MLRLGSDMSDNDVIPVYSPPLMVMLFQHMEGAMCKCKPQYIAPSVGPLSVCAVVGRTSGS